jgi:large conductance mechanosensitive channel
MNIEEKNRQALEIANKAKDKAKGFLDEFKTFAIKGNALELAVGLVIGTAFNAIVQSLVNDLIMGAIAQIFGKPDFSAFAYGAIKYGSFINALVNFLIVGLSVFVAVKAINKLFKGHEEKV